MASYPFKAKRHRSRYFPGPRPSCQIGENTHPVPYLLMKYPANSPALLLPPSLHLPTSFIIFRLFGFSSSTRGRPPRSPLFSEFRPPTATMATSESAATERGGGGMPAMPSPHLGGFESDCVKRVFCWNPCCLDSLHS